MTSKNNGPSRSLVFTLFGLLLVACAGSSEEFISSQGQLLESNGDSLYPPISYDGQLIAFYSLADNLVPEDGNGAGDIFLYDVASGTTTLLSVSSEGAQGNDDSTWPSISGDGRYVSFTSSASNLVPGIENGFQGVFVHDIENGITTLASMGINGEEADGNSYTYFPSIADDGRYVVFLSEAGNLVSDDINTSWDVFVHDVAEGVTKLASISSDGEQGNGPSLHASISGNGRYVTYQSEANNLVVNDLNDTQDIFVHDVAEGVTKLASISSDGEQGNGPSSRASLSYDGRYVFFESLATNLVPDDTNEMSDVFVHDLEFSTTKRVSVNSEGEQMQGAVVVGMHPEDPKAVASPNGECIIFRSSADNLVPNDTNEFIDIFVHNLETGETKRVSVASDGQEPDGPSEHLAISFDCTYASFSSEASNLVPEDTNIASDVFIHNLDTGITSRVSVALTEE